MLMHAMVHAIHSLKIGKEALKCCEWRSAERIETAGFCCESRLARPLTMIRSTVEIVEERIAEECVFVRVIDDSIAAI